MIKLRRGIEVELFNESDNKTNTKFFTRLPNLKKEIPPDTYIHIEGTIYKIRIFGKLNSPEYTKLSNKLYNDSKKLFDKYIKDNNIKNIDENLKEKLNEYEPNFIYGHFVQYGLYDKETLIGIASCITDRKVYLDSLYILPKYRGKGLARILLDYIVENTNKDIFLIVLKNNYDAIKFYESYNFKIDNSVNIIADYIMIKKNK